MTRHTLLVAVATLFFGVTMTGHGQEPYKLPPKEVVDIIDATPDPGVSLSPDTSWMLLIDRTAMPGIEDVARRMLRLGGMRIDPAGNCQFQTRFNAGLSVRKRDGGDAVRVPIPTGGKLLGTTWSHDSKAFAFTVVTDTGMQLWAATPETAAKPVLLTDAMSGVMGGVSWFPDAKRLLVRVVPKNRGPEPAAPKAPMGPNIQESSGNKSPTRTYQDLLGSPYDEALFEHYCVGQLTIIELDGTQHPIGAPGLYSGVSISPDANHLLVTQIKKPFSYLLTYRSFPQSIEVWNLKGEREYQVADVPMAENIPIQGVRLGRRSVRWKTGSDATLMWVEALDGGDPNQKADHRDKLMTLAAPFSGSANEVLKTQHRFSGAAYFQDKSLMAVTDYDRDKRWVRTLLYDLEKMNAEPRVLMDRSIRDRYGDPGTILGVPDANGRTVARQDGNWIYRAGAGASPEGNLPFLDRQDLDTLKTERLWRCEKGAAESVVAIVESSLNNKPTVITARETPTEPDNFFLKDLNNDNAAALTDYQDPTPQIRGIKKQLVKYERSDGVPLSATLYLPADYKEGTRLPLLVWAYPREFNDAKTAGQISGSPWQFTRMGGITHLTLLTQGYAIMDAATMPVIGDPETMNDTFIEQIVDAAKAAIDKAVDMGVADRDRVCVGGHSYGAFMTANLMAHSKLFKAGIARSGAYNRTLTPFGFQSERRTYWEAKDIYHSISPFMHADKIQDPILFIHGENDNNSGTFPLQSKRMYQAIKGHGGTVRLVMLPHESHGYRARESVLHTQAEMIEWFAEHLQ